MPSAVIIPSGDALLRMIATAEAKFEADREQAILRKEARREEMAARAWAHAVAVRQRIDRWGV